VRVTGMHGEEAAPMRGACETRGETIPVVGAQATHEQLDRNQGAHAKIDPTQTEVTAGPNENAWCTRHTVQTQPSVRSKLGM
jgi:hypothetical protein